MDTKQFFVDYALRKIVCTLLIKLLFHFRSIHNNTISQLPEKVFSGLTSLQAL